MIQNISCKTQRETNAREIKGREKLTFTDERIHWVTLRVWWRSEFMSRPLLVAEVCVDLSLLNDEKMTPVESTEQETNDGCGLFSRLLVPQHSDHSSGEHLQSKSRFAVGGEKNTPEKKKKKKKCQYLWEKLIWVLADLMRGSIQPWSGGVLPAAVRKIKHSYANSSSSLGSVRVGGGGGLTENIHFNNQFPPSEEVQGRSLHVVPFRSSVDAHSGLFFCLVSVFTSHT